MKMLFAALGAVLMIGCDSHQSSKWSTETLPGNRAQIQQPVTQPKPEVKLVDNPHIVLLTSFIHDVRLHDEREEGVALGDKCITGVVSNTAAVAFTNVTVDFIMRTGFDNFGPANAVLANIGANESWTFHARMLVGTAKGEVQQFKGCRSHPFE